MNIAGIVCEYNPMHRSHVYHIEKTKECLGGDTAVVCVMSGDFVQRGEPAVMNKFARAKAAVMSGANLVIENPAPWCISSAERFAFGAVSILDSIGVCTHISFGSESGDIEPLAEAAEALGADEVQEYIGAEIRNGLSYAAARQKAAEIVMGKSADFIKMPNNILAIEYLKALSGLKSNIEPVTIKRFGAGHDDMKEGESVSASLIREKLLAGADIKDNVPGAVFSVIEEEAAAGRAPVTMDAADTAIMSGLRKMTMPEFMRLPDSAEELYWRLKSAAADSTNIKEVIEKARTKRYSYARIRRVLLYLYLGFDSLYNAVIPPRGAVPYARVLAFDGKGREVLGLMKKTSKIPVITKPSKVREIEGTAGDVFDLNARISDLYSLLYPNVSERHGNRDYRNSPFVYGKE